MALVLADRVRETTTTTGTGTVTLSGTAPTGYQTFSTAIGNANTTYYTINAGFQWEVGIGTYTTAGLTLSRDTVLSSSSGGTLVDFAVGTKDVFVTYPAEKSVNYNASNNVGIGTTAPTRLLSVYDGDAAITKDTASAASSIIYMNKGRGSAGAPANISSGDNLGAVWFNGYSGSGNNNGYGYGAYVGGAADGAVSAGTVPGRLVFATTTSGDSSPTERMRINSSGNVGIGTNSPTGTIGAGYTSRLTAYAAANAAIDVKDVNGNWLMGTTGGAFTLYSNTASAERMRIDTSGNAGIGTNAPIGRLTLQGAAGTSGINQGLGLLYSNGTQYGAFGLNNSSGWPQLMARAGAGLTFHVNSDLLTTGEAMRITSAGDVGIGTTVPVAKLHVVGKIIGVADGTYSSVGAYGFRFSTFTNAARVLWGGYDNALNAGFIQATELDIQHTSLLLNPNGGNVGIGTTSPAAKLAVVDGAIVAGGVGDVLIGRNSSGFPTSGAGTGYFKLRTINDDAVSGGIVIDTLLSGALNERFRITSAGNVGIGAAAPSHRLEVSGSLCVDGFSDSTTNYISLRKGFAPSVSGGVGFTAEDHSGSSSDGLGCWGQDGIRFSTAQAERMRITSSGDLGIGTTAPTTGSMSNVAILNAGVFATLRGSVASTSGVAVTIGTSTLGGNETYIVSVGIFSGAPTVYSAVAIVSADGSVLRSTTLQTASLMTISVSGTNIQALQASGGPATIQYSIIRIA